VAIGTAHLRARRIPAAGATVSSTWAQPEDAELVGHRKHRQVRAERVGDAAAARDLFLDVIVLLSVAMFLVLALGVGILVLRSASGS
jgi:hypothetical protein